MFNDSWYHQAKIDMRLNHKWQQLVLHPPILSVEQIFEKYY